jgi:aspartate ammonia-lyase
VKARNATFSRHINAAANVGCGYEHTAALVAKAVESGRPLIEIVEAENVMSRERMLGLLHQSSKHPDPLSD